MISRRSLLAAALLCLGTPAAPAAETAIVGPAGAVVRSGPDPSYYATQRLDPGASVEVYERLPNGFCAIRPPEGEFSWAPASDIETLGNGVGAITREGVASRVGSVLAPDQHDAVHVRLELGERVQVIGEAQVDTSRWLKILPPAGEFRWIDATALGDGPAQRPTPDRVEKNSSGWVTTTVLEEESGAAGPTQPAAGAEARPAVPVTPIELPADAPFATKLAVLEVRLARTVAEPPNLWRFEAVEAAAATLMSQAENEQQRAAVRDLAARADRFAALAGRYRASRVGPIPTDRLAAPRRFPAAAGSGPIAVEQVQPNASGGAGAPGGYDAVGVVRQVVSSRPGFPAYALVGDDGKIVSLLTPSADLNLQPLLGKRVGVRGVRGFMPEYQQQHVTASRVTPVESVLR
ncbi:hypothetical protein Pla175_32670 [Pirellulimonas nuda]|uniref:SH3 domain-containing protein n=1 Tax=Pirellulimonas nuda TaxID=2528009 RepID=A0A518DEG5_9BACT|nr:SH3 domain-containing protein [Pirellulimonas nuda]QDU89871.1 hypothetical protein Pla175_32670 [Pirellulimonas nuda]